MTPFRIKQFIDGELAVIVNDLDLLYVEDEYTRTLFSLPLGDAIKNIVDNLSSYV